jgi:hypothetical protein
LLQKLSFFLTVIIKRKNGFYLFVVMLVEGVIDDCAVSDIGATGVTGFIGLMGVVGFTGFEGLAGC